jgi:glucoamylase
MTETIIRTVQYTRAQSNTAQVPRQRTGTQRTVQRANLEATAQHMLSLMLRNISSDGFQFTDPANPGRFSRPGCIIAAPCYPAGTPGVDQDYVFNWTRDAAMAAMEIAAAKMPRRPGTGVQTLIDYVNFARLCQDRATPTVAHACYTIEGESRPWTEQADGPALQTLALLRAFPQLGHPGQEVASQVIARNMDFMLSTRYEPTVNLWEEQAGYSFFARAVQLRCLREIAANTHGIGVPQGTGEAIDWLNYALEGHWDGTRYLSMLAPSDSGPVPVTDDYDPNIDIVMACAYGAVPCTDTRLLATAAQLRWQWSDSASPTFYQVNVSDGAHGLGPMMGRYPGDTYDGDVSDPVPGGHPWALCTCSFAELYYRLAADVSRTRSLPYDHLSSKFFGQVGIDADTPPAEAVTLLERAGDAMLQAVIYHSSDDLELSEQFDATSGFEKSVSDLTWSYAAFLSAVRARTARNAEG